MNVRDASPWENCYGRNEWRRYWCLLASSSPFATMLFAVLFFYFIWRRSVKMAFSKLHQNEPSFLSFSLFIRLSAASLFTTPFPATVCKTLKSSWKEDFEKLANQWGRKILWSCIFYKCPNIYIYLQKNQIVLVFK